MEFIIEWWDILTIKFNKHGDLIIQSWGYFPALILLIIIAYYTVKRWRQKTSWDVVEAEIPWAGGKIKIKPDYQDIQVAHKAWVELATRKAGLPFDEEHDVIVEIYNSWYALFAELRNLAKQIPAEKVRRSNDTRELVNLLVDALNNGLRPHLTCWQARFRRWYDEESRQNIALTPQEIQKEYLYYNELVLDLRIVNRELMNYTDFIRRIAHGKAD